MSSSMITLPRMEAASNAATPGLIVMFGASANKKLLLNRPVILVGSGPVCDIKLKTPDIGEVHALVMQTPEGLLLRDCKSSTGTLVNGDKVEEILLKNEDLLQFGTFQFKARVPDGWPAKALAETAAAHAAAMGQPVAAPVAPLPATNGTHAPESNGVAGDHPPSDERVETLEQKRRRLTQMAWGHRNQTQFQAKQLQDAQVRISQLESELRHLKAQQQETQQRDAEIRSQHQAELEKLRQDSEAKCKTAESAASGREQELQSAQTALQIREADVERRLAGLNDREQELAGFQQEIEAQKREMQAHGLTHQESLSRFASERQEFDGLRTLWESKKQERESILAELGEEEVLFRSELTSLRDQLSRFQQEKVEADRRKEALLTETHTIQESVDRLRQEEKLLQEQCQKLREEQTLASKPLEERHRFLQELEESLRRQQEEFNHQKEAWTAMKAQQEAELDQLRNDLTAQTTQLRSTLADLDEQKKTHANRQLELERWGATLKESEEELERQKQAIQRETEQWFDQRDTLAKEVTSRQDEIDVLLGRCKELRLQEARLESSNAEWNAHLEREQRELEQLKAKIKTEAEAEARSILEKERNALTTFRDRVEKQVSQLYAQTEVHLEQCLNLIQTEKERFGELREEYEPAQSS